MNEEAQKILVDLLKKATDGIDSAVAFSQAQIPDVVQQLIQYKLISYGLRVFSFAVIMIACIIIFQWIRKRREDNSISIVVTVVVFFFSAFSFVINVQNVIQITIAPKVWLLEYAASLVK
ncbi:hypothetical protein [Salmonella enterica]|uniref:Uncharacterized protein n=1 Tax=Salmonella phage vB_Se_STGO-35-1 TaxID=2749381 RepID=A0A889IN96_9CAUD|nr:hypothetical protein [Salmonella enterica]YP_010054060.1 hypothetical protein KGB48_gp40 [Salmonella phage vB_Se_STGO-35-1]QRD99775.1 hypothetical protein JKL37_0039 [Salmonella phage vB_Se_STGO-35-1]